MSRLVIALLVGALLGAAVFLVLRRESVEPAGAGVATTPKSSEPSREPDELKANFVSATHPGLVVSVLRAGAAEPGARVELSRAARSLVTSELVWEPAGLEKTSPEGRASFPAMAGHYFVIASAEDGARAIEAVDVSWATSSTVVTLTLAAPKTFSGRVVDAATHQPIAGAVVRADPQTEDDTLAPTVAAARTTTDSLGRFAFELPVKRFRFEARAPGYLPNAAEEDKELLIELSRGIRLSGLVVDEANQPVADATVRITPGDVTSLLSDHEGRFSFTATRGSTSLHVLAPDGRQGLVRVTPDPKTESEQVRIVVGSGSELTGVVRDEKGPVAQVDVRVLAEPESLEVAAFATGSDGRFAAKGLPAGRYSVRAQQGRGRRATAVGLELPGAAPVELVLGSAGRVIGMVIDDENRPLAGASVAIHWPDGLKEVKRTARTGEDGHFEFDDLLASQAFVRATLADLVSEEAAAYVAPGATVELNLRVAVQGRIAGTLTGRPVDKVFAHPDRPGGEFIEMEKTDRHFEKSLPPGTYNLFAEVKGPSSPDYEFVQTLRATVRSGEVTTVVLDVPFDADASALPGFRMHDQVGSGLSFENSPGGVRVDFLMADCPAAKAGMRGVSEAEIAKAAIILSIVPPSDALALAERLAPHLSNRCGFPC